MIVYFNRFALTITSVTSRRRTDVVPEILYKEGAI